MSMHKEMAESIGVKLVEPASSYRSIQSDAKSCHFIALGILKDLTKKDLEEISTFENGFKPLAKSLKYSQSGIYIENMLSENTRNEEVKKGLTAGEYRNKYKTEDDLGARRKSNFPKKINQKNLKEIFLKVFVLIFWEFIGFSAGFDLLVW